MKQIALGFRLLQPIRILALSFALVVGSSIVHAQFAQAHPTYSLNTLLKGSTGEAVSDVIFVNEGWVKLSIKPLNSKHGLDGVYVKRSFNGSIKDVLFVESKAEGSRLALTQIGQQGSQAYIKGQLARYRMDKLSGLPTDHPLVLEYNQLDAFCSKMGYPSRIVHSSFSSGKLNITMHPISSLQPAIAIEGKATLEETVNLGNPQGVFQRKLADGFTKELRQGLDQSGFSPEKATMIIDRVKSGEIPDWLPIKKALEELPVARLDPLAAELRAGRIIPMLHPPVDIMQYATVASRGKSGITTTEVASGILLPNGRVLMTAGKAGIGAGLLTFAVDGGVATFHHIKGTLLDADYERELGYAAINGTSVAAGVAVAVVLGATPAGWVVLAVASGAYVVTDFAIECYENTRDFSSLTIEDLKAFGIPVSNRPDFGIPPSKTLKVFN